MSDPSRTLSRRDLLKIGAAGAMTIAPAFGSEATASTAGAIDTAAQSIGAAAGEPLQALTAVEADLLEAIVARLIPTDENGPGATEARAARYIDRALAGALASFRDVYRTGLAALDRYARATHGAAFTALSPADQDAALMAMEADAAATVAGGFPGSPGQFFALLRGHTLQGTFGDPFYGGNANFVGWDLIGYPGVRTFVSADEQRMGITLQPNHRSAYDGNMFNRAQASAAHEQDRRHGE